MIIRQLLHFAAFLLHLRAIDHFWPILRNVLIKVMLTGPGLSIIDVESLIFKALNVEDFTGLQVDHACPMSVHYHNYRIGDHVEVEIGLHKIANVYFVYALSIKLWRMHRAVLAQMVECPNSVLVHIESVYIFTCYKVKQVNIAAYRGYQYMVLGLFAVSLILAIVYTVNYF